MSTSANDPRPGTLAVSETVHGSLGIVLDEATPERVVASLEVGPRVHQPFGYLHGGVSVVLAESCASIGASLAAGPEHQVFGMEINANHIRPVRDGRITCIGEPVHVGRSSQVWDMVIRDDQDRLVCVSMHAGGSVRCVRFGDVSDRDQILSLVDLMLAHAPVLVLTGAGISTGSGLPDYRGPDGLWRNRRFEELASIEMFRSEPQEFWEFYRMRLDGLRHAAPNAAHHALADLERHGIVDAVITQNVDGLHRAAGSSVVEVHGTLERVECLECGDSQPTDMALGASDDRGIPRCSCGAPFKPDVVLFGEMLPPALDHAWNLVERCRMLLVLGSSLAVQPVGSLARVAAAGGATVAIINRGASTADHLADIRIDGDLLEHLPVVAELALARHGLVGGD